MKDYDVTLEFIGVNAENPTDAAEQVATWITDNASELVFTVTDDIGDKTTIDLDIGE